MSDDVPGAGSAEPTRHAQAEGDDEALSLPEIDGRLETLLVPVDGSAGSEKGLAYGALLAQLTGAAVVVVVAFDPPVVGRRRTLLAVQQARAEMEEEAKELAQEAAQLLLDRGVQARAVVVVGDPVSAILETAEEEGADLIVMGRRGLGGLRGLIGSVSERVARHAEVPVFLTT